MVRIISTAAVVLAFSSSAYGVTEEEIQVALACRKQCDQYREESSSSMVCGKWGRTLPRPKVGRSCTDAFDTMFKNTCLNMCNGKEVTVDVHGHCSEKRREMPKPVVGHACNDGYEGGYAAAAALFSDGAAEAREAAKREETQAEREAMVAAVKEQKEKKDQADLLAARKAAVEAHKAMQNNKGAPVAAEEKKEEEPVAAEEPAAAAEEPAVAVEEPAAPVEEEGGLRGTVEEVAEEVRKVIATLPVTVDESDINLVIYEGQQAAEAVDDFCKKHMASAGVACMDQLLPHVERKLSDKL